MPCERPDPAVLEAWRRDAEPMDDTAAIDRLLRKEGVRTDASLLEDIAALLQARRTYRWRIAEFQKLADDGYDAGDRRVLRASRTILHFILTGRLP